jgi:hypothetical protein
MKKNSHRHYQTTISARFKEETYLSQLAKFTAPKYGVQWHRNFQKLETNELNYETATHPVSLHKPVHLVSIQQQSDSTP